MRALDHQDPGMLNKLPELMGGQDLGAILTQGSGLLKLIFGENFSATLDLLSKSFGIGGKSTSTLLSIMAPIVMSLLQQQRSALDLTSAGSSSCCWGKRSFSRGKLPDGLGDLVGLAEALCGGQVREAGSAQPASVSAKTNSAVPQADASLPSRLLPLIVLLARALIAWQLFSKRPDTNCAMDTITAPMDTESMLTPGAADMELQGPP